MPELANAGRIHELALDYRNALEARNLAAADRLARSLTEVQNRVNAEVSNLLKKLEAAREAGVDPSPAWLYQQKRLAAVTDAIRREVGDWAPYASSQIRGEALWALERGQAEARLLTREAARVELPGLDVSFTDLDLTALQQVTAHLHPQGPLQALLVEAGAEAAEAASKALVTGVALGKGTDWIARELGRAMDIPRWRAETIARTESLRAYREASRMTFTQSTVVGTWVWTCWVDRRTCVACVVMHGTEHPVTETLDGHPRCRCVMVPRTKSWQEILGEDAPDLPDTRPPLPDGKGWLASQSQAVQTALMGPAKFRAYKAGRIDLDDMVARTRSTAWGTMRRERSLIEIREGRNANFTTPAKPAPEPQPAPRPAPAADPLRSGPEYDYQRGLMRQMDADRLNAIAFDDNVPRTRQLAALDEVKARLEGKGGPGLPAGIPKSRHSAEELERFQGVLRTLPEEQLPAQLHQADKAVAWLAREEYERRRLAKPEPSYALADTLKRKDNPELAPWESPEFKYDVAAVNPRWRENRQWQVNCSNTTQAWELRRRGYDVTAQPRRTGRGRARAEYHGREDGWDIPTHDWAEELTLVQAERRMIGYGNGARGSISVNWKGGGAHVFNWEVHGGEVYWVDAQPGRWGKGLKPLLEGSLKGKVQMARLDDKPIPDAIVRDYVRSMR